MKKSLTLASLLVALIVLVGCSTSSVSEKEPNDTLAAATPAQVGQQVVGHISAAADRDAIVLRLVGRQLISFELTHAHDEDLAVDVYVAGRHVKTIDSLAASTSRQGRKPLAKTNAPAIEHAALLDTQGKDCILVVHAPLNKGRWPVAWSLVTSAKPQDGLTEEEPNDDLEDALFLVEGRSVEGRYSPTYHARLPGGFERDVYAWINDSTNRVLLEVDVSGVPDVNAVIDVLDERGRVRRTIDGKGLHLGEQTGPLGITSSATCYFAVRNDVIGAGNFRLPYAVFVRSRPASASEEFEPNDTLETANTLAPNIECKASLYPQGEKDCFSLPIPEAGRYTLSVRVSPDDGLDPVVELFDHQGRRLHLVNDAGAGKPEYVPNYGFEATTASRVSIRVSAKDPQATGNYALVASLYPAGPFTEFEPNHEQARANRIEPGVDIRGFLFPAKDQDWLKIDLPSAGLLDLRLASPAGTAASLTCLDKAGLIIGQLAPASGDLRLAVKIQSAGRYMIKIAAEAAGNPRDPWVLHTAFTARD